MTYQKDCKECGKRIIMSDDTGKWLPFNLDNSPHRCMTDDEDEDEEQYEEPVGSSKPAAQENKGVVVPRMTKPITKAFESPDIQLLCKWHQAYITTVESLGAQVHGSTLQWNFGNGTFVMVTWLAIPNNNYDAAMKL